MQTRYCRICSEPKDPEEMQQMNKNDQFGRCKLCHSSQMALHYKLKRAEARPQDYMTCNDCDHIFYRYQPTGRRVFSIDNALERTECPECKSKEIEDY